MSALLMQFFVHLNLAEILYSANCLSVCTSIFPLAVSSKRAFLENKIIEALSTVVDTDGDIDTLKVLTQNDSKLFVYSQFYY